jgi:hypothetical protein
MEEITAAMMAVTTMPMSSSMSERPLERLVIRVMARLRCDWFGWSPR